MGLSPNKGDMMSITNSMTTVSTMILLLSTPPVARNSGDDSRPTTTNYEIYINDTDNPTDNNNKISDEIMCSKREVVVV